MSDYEMPRKRPGVIDDHMAKGWAEPMIHHMLADYKARAEAMARAHT